MTKDDCNFNLSWNYSGWRNDPMGSALYNQNSWNQTLIAKINQCSAQINKASLVGGANRITTNLDIQPLFETMEFYSFYHLSGRYLVDFNNKFNFKFGRNESNNENVIYVYNNKINDIYLLVPVLNYGEPPANYPEIAFKFPESVEQEINYKRKLCGSVTIVNYNQDY